MEGLSFWLTLHIVIVLLAAMFAGIRTFLPPADWHATAPGGCLYLSSIGKPFRRIHLWTGNCIIGLKQPWERAMRLMTLFFVGALSLPAFGSEMMTVEPAFERLDKEREVKALSCDELAAEISRIERNLTQLLSDNIRLLDNISYTLQDWYRTLSRFEGQETTFRYGYFRPIQDSARVIDRDRSFFMYEFRDSLDRLRDTEIMADTCRRQ